MEEAKNIIIIVIYRIVLSTSETNWMNGTNIITYEDLSEFALNLKSIASTAGDEQEVGERRREDRYQVKCYICDWYGYRSFECHSRDSVGSQHPRDQPGRKAPDCPKGKGKAR